MTDGVAPLLRKDSGRWTTIDIATISDPATVTDEQPDWIIPGYLERGSRLLLAGDEGVGKSLFAAQWAVRLAAGLPVVPAGGPPAPLRVMMIDTELNERTVRRRLTPMAEHAQLTAGQLIYVLAPAGLDLLRPEERIAFTDLCARYRPHLLGIDSLYRAFVGDPDDPRIGGEVQRILDDARASLGCGLLVACHYRKRPTDGSRRRNLDDIAGSRVWKAWPELVADLTTTSLRVLKDREGAATDLALTRAAAGEWEPDPDGWPFTITAGEPREPWQGHTLVQPYILDVLSRSNEPISGLQVSNLVKDDRVAQGKKPFHRDTITAALGELETRGHVNWTPGQRNAKRWALTPTGLQTISRDAPKDTP